MKYALRLVAGAAVLALAPVILMGCGASKKMTASQTALWIERHYAPAITRATCLRATYWDYECTVQGAVPPRTAWYNVNTHQVTDASFRVDSR